MQVYCGINRYTGVYILVRFLWDSLACVTICSARLDLKYSVATLSLALWLSFWKRRKNEYEKIYIIRPNWIKQVFLFNFRNFIHDIKIRKEPNNHVKSFSQHSEMENSVNLPFYPFLACGRFVGENNWKNVEIWQKLRHTGIYLIVLGKGVAMNTNMTGFDLFSNIFAVLCLRRKRVNAKENFLKCHLSIPLRFRGINDLTLLLLRLLS